MIMERTTPHSVDSRNLADLLERILDKGIVVSGDIRINLVDVELLTIQIRLVVCSIDKAREMGLDWWANQSAFGPQSPGSGRLLELEERLARLEAGRRPRKKKVRP